MRTIYEDSRIKVQMNSSDEVFVEMKNQDPNKFTPGIRVSPYVNSLLVTAAGCRMSPTSYNGLDAFRVTS